MIQRIQSVYLTLVLVFSILCFAFPIASYESANVDLQFNLIPQTLEINTLPLILIISVVGILAAVSVFLYKNRQLQVRVIAVTMLINMIYIGLVFLLYVDKFSEKLELNFKSAVTITYSAGSILPILSLILLFLANKAVRNDDRKVRAADRLR